MKMVRTVLALVVCVAMVGTLAAAEGRGRGQGQGQGQGQRAGRQMPEGGPGMGDPAARIDMMLRSLDLTDEQKTKIAELKQEFGPKLKAAQEKQDSILTDEQKKARIAAFQKVRESGEGWQNMRETIEKAMNLTDSQKKEMETARTATMELNRELIQKIMSLLTPEQKETLEKARQGRGQRDGLGGGQRGGQGGGQRGGQGGSRNQ